MPQWFVSFRTEYKSKNLHGACKEQKVSYTKMLHCLRNDSYRKPSATPVSSDEEQGLHPLVVEPADSVTIIFQIEGFFGGCHDDIEVV